MKISRELKPGFFTGLLMGLFLIIMGFRTLNPNPLIYSENLLGTETTCPMAPVSTVSLVFLGVITIVFTLLLLTRRKGREKS